MTLVSFIFQSKFKMMRKLDKLVQSPSGAMDLIVSKNRLFDNRL